MPQPLRLFLTTGIIGGFTTFSTFSLDAACPWERGEIVATVGHVVKSVALSIAALFLGLWFIRQTSGGLGL